jgi:hypothetical protein
MRAVALLVVLAVTGACPPTPPPKIPVKPQEPVSLPPPPTRELPEVTVAQARSRFKLEVLGIELVGTVDPKAAEVARQLTLVLRSLANTDPLIALGKRNADLIDAKVLAGCQNDEPACMEKIASTVGADRIVYGIINDNKDSYYVHLTMLDARRKVSITWTGNTLASEEEILYTAKVALSSLISRSP